jgi:uncharacterized protein YjdB
MNPRRTFFPLVVLLLLCFAAPILAAQQGEKQEVSLTIEPAHITLNAGETQKFSARLVGAPASTVVAWAVPYSERDVSTVSQDGRFTAKVVGIYRVFAVATSNNKVLKTAVAKVTVVAQYDDPRP